MSYYSRRAWRRFRRRYLGRMTRDQQILAAVVIGGVILIRTHPTTAAAPAPARAGTAAAGITTAAGPPPRGPLTSGQRTFDVTLATATGLNSRVIAAWELAEESAGAAVARQAANNNDWLNIGYTDTATFGAADAIWGSPVTAAQATAGWLKGQNTIPGYGRASSGVQAILATAGQPAAVQITAIQGSGWASSGYPDLPSLYQQTG